MKHIFYSAILALIAMLCTQCAPTDKDVKAASDLAARITGEAAKSIKFVKSEATDSVDRFTLSSEGSKIVISANNAGTMAVGLNYYLKNYCLTEVSWHLEEPVEMPDVLPVVEEPVTVEAILPNRFFLNYCTFGYSMPWWSWNQWERFIDWMALNGVNLPLAITGQEAIWYNVWTKLGLSDEEVRSYFTGPAHLPWHRMCNLDRWQGPLPHEWLDKQAEMQKQIVARERELSMRPVLPGFAGHVPADIMKKYPNAKTSQVSKWGGFPKEYSCTYLSPTDSLFAVIQKEYLTEQTKLYGTDHIYGIDPFNEVDPPTWNADSLAAISRGIYESVAAVDPDAIWLQMAWFLYSDPTHWTPETTKAFLQGVPQGKMILLDYYCERTEEWKIFDSFYGQPYIWNYLGNFGGNTFLISPFKDVQARIEDVLANGGSNLCGIGSTLEGLDYNPYMYEFVLEHAWKMPENHNGITNTIDRRIGAVDNAARESWQLLVDSIFIDPTLCGQGALINARPSLDGFSWWTCNPNIRYANTNLVDAWKLMLDADSKRDAHVFDCVNIGRQAMSNYFMLLRDEFYEAYLKGDTAAMTSKGDEIKELLSDITTILRGHSKFSLKNWIDNAREYGSTPELKDYYERNARTLVTVWGYSKNLNDYANRQWADLNEYYYSPRWHMLIDRAIEAKANGKEFDNEEFYNASREFEYNWIEPDKNTIDYLEPLDGIEVSKQMYQKYADRIKAKGASAHPTAVPSIHHW